jgi:UDP-N-acetylglucosamine 2-epimerase
MNNKIGCALITCDRPEFYKISVGSLMDAIQKKDIEYIVINDGKEKLPYYPLNFFNGG